MVAVINNRLISASADLCDAFLGLLLLVVVLKRLHFTGQEKRQQ